MDSDVESFGFLDDGLQTPRALGARNLDPIVRPIIETLVRGREGMQVAGW
jgi:hypothetical protein